MPNLPSWPFGPAHDDAADQRAADERVTDARATDQRAADARDTEASRLEALLAATATGAPDTAHLADGASEADVADVAGLADVAGFADRADFADVAEVLRFAAAPAEPAELAGESAAITAFRAQVDARQPRMRAAAFACSRRAFANNKRSFTGSPNSLTGSPNSLAGRTGDTLSRRLRTRAVACMAAGAVTLMGAATAAYACVLPAPIQSFAHHTIAAPAPATDRAGMNADHRDPTAGPSSTRAAAASGLTSRSASDSASASSKVAPTPGSTDLSKRIQQLRQLAASGLCGDYAAATKAGTVLDSHELAALARLAGGMAINAYCAKIPVLPLPACGAGPHATLAPPSVSSKQGNGWWSWCGCSPAATEADSNPHDVCDAIMSTRNGSGDQPAPARGGKPLPRTTPPGTPSAHKTGPATPPLHPGHGTFPGPFPWVNGHAAGGPAPQHHTSASAGSSTSGSASSQMHPTG